jgi:hypothetical protein
MNFFKILTYIGVLTICAYQNETITKNQLWRHTGSAIYTNLDSTGIDTIWKLLIRDSIFYDELGNAIGRQASCANSGWKEDSLLYSSNTTIFENDMVRYEINYFNQYIKNNPSFRSECKYFNDNKSYIETSFALKDNVWIPDESMSCTVSYSRPVKVYHLDTVVDYTGFLNHKSRTVSYEKIVPESNDTTLSLKYRDDTNRDKKVVYLFISPVLLYSNCYKVLNLEKSSTTGNFDTLSYTNINNSGTFTYRRYYSRFIPESFTHTLRDSHNNDTITYEVSFRSPTIGDTIRYTRYKRKYDTYGNNVDVITVLDSAGSYVVNMGTKVINSFVQCYELPALKLTRKSNFTVGLKIKNNTFTLSAPAISNVVVYNSAGRKILTVRSDKKESISFNCSSMNKKLSTGLYFFQLSYGKNERYSFPVFIATSNVK